MRILCFLPIHILPLQRCGTACGRESGGAVSEKLNESSKPNPNAGAVPREMTVALFADATSAHYPRHGTPTAASQPLFCFSLLAIDSARHARAQVHLACYGLAHLHLQHPRLSAQSILLTSLDTDHPLVPPPLSKTILSNKTKSRLAPP